MAKLPGKPFNAVAGDINTEIAATLELVHGDKSKGIKPVPTVRTKSSRRVSLHKRKQN